MHINWKLSIFCQGYCLFTNAMTSLVANANMSAHETLLWQPGTLSTAALALITVSNPSPASERFIGLSFSDVLFLVASITDASHPYPTCTKGLVTPIAKEVHANRKKKGEIISYSCNYSDPNKTIMEEEPKCSRSCHKCLLKFLLNRTSYNRFNIWTCVFVVINSKLSMTTNYQQQKKQVSMENEAMGTHFHSVAALVSET